MKKLLIAATALALTSGMGMAQTVRIASEGAYAPYNLINDKGELDGYEIELGNEMCKRAELTCTWVKNDFDAMIPNLVSSNFDAIMAGMSITDERKKQSSSPRTTCRPPSAYMALSADADVKGGIVAAQTGTIQSGYVAQSGATLVEFGTFDEATAAVRNGEADAIFADKEYLVPLVNEGSDGFAWVGEDVVLGDGIGMGLRQSDTELKDKFDAAIASMKADGSINTLIEKWFGPEAQKFPTN
ncbi:transporter substrate-binding domain-containing protein [Paracoccus cavernae]|uniref:Transporter substrate-binding domain-containing protein n=1 Tax=Paracoccus cavernae TaxID=1571207 RepID=A0ABT8D7C7_9RHOB|nr:transporter substrate-binding domain-containing protein [Paracoccus cavernae]